MRGHRRSSDKARGPQSVGWLLTARCRRGPAVPDPGTEEAEENMSTGWTAPGSTGQPAGHEPGPANGSGGPAPHRTTGPQRVLVQQVLLFQLGQLDVGGVM